MANWLRNVRFGLRLLTKDKAFTTAAILALALGIGPNVAIFSIIWATFLAPLPYPHADRLVVVWTKIRGERGGTRADDYAQLASHNKSFERLDFASWNVLHLTNPDHTENEAGGLPYTPGAETKTMGVHMALGRDFLPDEGVPGKNHLVVLRNKLWREQFHSDPNIIGKSILIEDEPYTVVGVVEAGSLDRTGVLFDVPQILLPGIHHQDWGSMLGRLKPGVTIQQAQAELDVIHRNLAAASGNDPQLQQSSISVEQLKNDWLDRKVERNLWLLLASVGCVLLIACANVANLLLARGAGRQQEIAVRTALGATPAQIFIQLVTESLTLAVLGGAIGIALGWVMMKLSMAILPDLAKQSAEAVVQLNWPVVCYALAATLLSGIIFGCAPAWYAARLNLSETLKQGSRSVTGRSRMRTQGILVVSEFALALTLLSGAGMALHSFSNLSRIDLGVRTDHVLTAFLERRVHHRGPRKSPEELVADGRGLLSKVGALPGAETAALTSAMPLEGREDFPFNLVGHDVPDAERPHADLQTVTPTFFQVFGVHLLQGRFLNDADTLTSPPVIMVNQSFVHRFLSGVDPLNQRLLFKDTEADGKVVTTEWQIVGVFHDILNSEHLTDRALPAMYTSYFQSPYNHMGIAVRTAIDPATFTGSLRSTIASIDPTITLTGIQTMQESVSSQMTTDRFSMVLFGGFAIVALLLAALGIYGVMAFAVAQRTHEIGLRMALGARQNQVVALMVTSSMRLALLGVGIGLAGVYLLGRLMRTSLYGVRTVDFTSFGIVALLLLCVALLASWLPARRSAKVDPMVALRQE